MSFNLTYLDRFKIENKRAGLTEPSGIALAHDGAGFWTVSDDTKRILYLGRGGKVDKGRSFKIPDNELEGVTTHPGGKTLFAVREKGNEILKLNIAKQSVMARQRLTEMEGYERIADYLADGGDDNKGLEGIAWNADTRSLFCVKESDPGLMIEVSSDLKKIRNHTLLTDEIGFSDPEGRAETVDYSGLCHDPARKALWVVSDRAKRLYLYCPKEERVLHSAALGYGRNGEYREVKQAEGVTVDPATGRLYIVSDAEARLYVFDVRA